MKAVLIFIFLVVPSLALADGSMKEAEKLLRLSGTEEAMNQMLDMTLAQELRNNPTLVPFEKVMREFLNKYLSFESTKDELAGFYVEVFSKAELKELNSFYETKLGQKAVKHLPGLMQKGGELGARRVQENMAELQDMIATEAERLKQLSAE